MERTLILVKPDAFARSLTGEIIARFERKGLQLIGAPNPLEAAPGSIRGDYAIEMGANMVHGSDSPEAAEREAALFFGEM